ncbi:hypothetical protein L3Q82_004492 [Scortum barcoo]|uniref:Uncharacterized protein n=1 Tax=Scortum barcoo TaxID=214431 RepID=A0ACB8VK05_9TELE|nr:hypothetical protein L3Q82_004492 [Scortum barcoo]
MSPRWGGRSLKLVREVERYRLEIVGLTSTHSLGSGTQLLERDWTLHYSGVAQGELGGWLVVDGPGVRVACPLRVGGEVLPQVEEFKYLGVLFTSEGKMEREIDRRIGAASAGAVMRSVYRTVVVKKELSRKAKLSIYQVNLRSHLTYGHELWVMTERTRSRIQAANSRNEFPLQGGWAGAPLEIGSFNMQTQLPVSHQHSGSSHNNLEKSQGVQACSSHGS